MGRTWLFFFLEKMILKSGAPSGRCLGRGLRRRETCMRRVRSRCEGGRSALHSLLQPPSTPTAVGLSALWDLSRWPSQWGCRSGVLPSSQQTTWCWQPAVRASQIASFQSLLHKNLELLLDRKGEDGELIAFSSKQSLCRVLDWHTGPLQLKTRRD